MSDVLAYISLSTHTYSVTVYAMGLEPQWDFADRLRKARRLSGLNQEEMAAAIGVKTPRYGHWESGRNEPEEMLLVCLAISRVTGVSTDWLLGTTSPDGDGGEKLPHLDSNQEPCDSPLAQVLRLRSAAGFLLCLRAYSLPRGALCETKN